MMLHQGCTNFPKICKQA